MTSRRDGEQRAPIITEESTMRPRGRPVRPHERHSPKTKHGNAAGGKGINPRGAPDPQPAREGWRRRGGRAVSQSVAEGREGVAREYKHSLPGTRTATAPASA